MIASGSVGYFSPFVPPEWIAAHGMRPAWFTLDRQTTHSHDLSHRGICPCAAAFIAKAVSRSASQALVITTVCDQMRYASAYLDTKTPLPAFLLNVPSTWQNPRSRGLYRDEIKRLGRFLVCSGGREPTSRQLASVIEQYHDRRIAALDARPGLSAWQWQETLVDLRSDLTSAVVAETPPDSLGGIPLLLVGGPLLAEDDSFLKLVERSGGRIIVDATETGERTLPGPVNRRRLTDDPLDELVRIYFDTIPDVFRRPNTSLYQWLGQQRSAHSIRGIILRRYPFCDLWHAELHRLRAWSNVPLLDIDVATGEEGETSRTQGRIEAFLEMLR